MGITDDVAGSVERVLALRQLFALRHERKPMNFKAEEGVILDGGGQPN
jgi:hypothetical protein